jgi:periplasmic copper chaperone A
MRSTAPNRGGKRRRMGPRNPTLAEKAKMTKTYAAVVAVAVLCVTSSVTAHVVLESKQAPAGSTYKAVLQVGHGCEGSPTKSLRIQIPEGVIAVKPMPKPGWELTTKRGEYAQAYDYFGEKLTEGVKEVAWIGGNLPDEWYDEFVLRIRLPNGAPGTVIRFPVVQECIEGVHRWIEIPAEGQDPDSVEEPAPFLTLTEKVE